MWNKSVVVEDKPLEEEQRKHVYMVAEFLEAYPEKFDMHDWIVTRNTAIEEVIYDKHSEALALLAMDLQLLGVPGMTAGSLQGELRELALDRIIADEDNQAIIFNGRVVHCGSAHCMAGASEIVAGEVDLAQALGNTAYGCVNNNAAERMGIPAELPGHIDLTDYIFSGWGIDAFGNKAELAAHFLRHAADHGWVHALREFGCDRLEYIEYLEGDDE